MKLLITLLSLTFFSCNDHHHSSLKEKLHKLDQSMGGKGPVESEQILKDRLDDFSYQKSRWNKKNDFYVLERFDKFKIGKCQQCHDSSKKIPNSASNHKEVSLLHANKEVMNCKTCHNTKDTWNLHMLNNEKVSINHPYKLCSQCHFEQVEDWSHGAHGKRVGGWHGKRVIKNCTSCHNPHKPQFHNQMPKVTPNFLKYKR